jgi:hypothetical protein
MRISDGYRNLLLKEFDHVLEKLAVEGRPDERMYYFSALHGAVNRILNFECTPDLVYLHHILNSVFTAFNQRIQAMMQGMDAAVKLDSSMLGKLVDATRDLAEVIRVDGDPSMVYRQLINLAYATTGNGYYLYEKGALRI